MQVYNSAMVRELSEFKINERMSVEITHINNPHSFYMLPPFYNQMLLYLEERGEQFEPSSLEIHSRVIYRSRINKKYIRGIVCHVDDRRARRRCVIYGMDYGFCDVSIPTRLIYYRTNDVDIPALAVQCQLHDCLPIRNRPWPQATIQAMASYFENEKADLQVVAIAPHKLIVTLATESGEDVATCLAFTGFTKLEREHQTTAYFDAGVQQLVEFPFTPYKVGQKLRVRVLRGRSLDNFYVVQLDDYKLYHLDTIDYTYYCRLKEDLHVDQIKVGSCVGVMIEETRKFERALVWELKPDSNNALVQLVDRGVMMEYPKSEMKPLPDPFLKRPVSAIYCRSISEPWDNGKQHFLTPGFQMMMTILHIGTRLEQPHIVHIYPDPKPEEFFSY